MGEPPSAEPMRASPASLRAGAWDLFPLLEGRMRLDGGAMWGVVPAALWRKLTPPDADNTIELALRPVLARRGADVVLIEPGIGSRWDAKQRALYRIDARPGIAAALAEHGLAPEDVTHVLATHCHWDHIGAWVVERAGELAPAFARARHFAPRVEIERCLTAEHARRGSYRPADVRPLLDAGLLAGYAGEFELLPGLVAHVLGGHSEGVSVVTFGLDAHRADAPPAIFWSDVVPTRHHAQPPYIMAFDIDVETSFRVRSEWLERAAAGGWSCLYYHDAQLAAGRLAREGKRYVCAPLA